MKLKDKNKNPLRIVTRHVRRNQLRKHQNKRFVYQGFNKDKIEAFLTVHPDATMTFVHTPNNPHRLIPRYVAWGR